MQSTTLYYREGASDKIYQITLEERAEGWVVNFAYGRRGSTLSTGTKTPNPVAYDEAVRLHDKLIREKTAKGYISGADTMAYADGSRRVTDIRPQLLNPVELTDLPRLLADPTFYLQPKLDGRRLLVQKRGDDITGINRRGIECGIPESVRNAALTLPGDFLIDGEAVGDVLHVFDLLELGGDFRGFPYRRRLAELLNLVASGQQAHIRVVPTYWDETDKCEAFKRLRTERSEGVVFKRESAPYTAGRPATGGDQLKLKFVETASVIISAINPKRSAAISLWKDARLVAAGNVTIPANQPIPQVGEVAEVRYLYAMPDSGSLFQPVFLGVRDDIAAVECQSSQLKFKAA